MNHTHLCTEFSKSNLRPRLRSYINPSKIGVTGTTERGLLAMNPGKTVSLERIAVTAKISQEDALAALRSLQHKDRTIPINVDELPTRFFGTR